MPIITRTTRYTSKTDIAFVLGASGSALSLLSGEAQGFAIDATTSGGSVAVIDTGTPANNKNDVLLTLSNLVQSGTSAKVVRWNDGTLHTISVGQIAQEYDGTRFGILIEPSATNLITASDNLSAASWSSSGFVSVSADAITAPDGTLTADKLVEDTSTNIHFIATPITTTSGSPFTYSVYAKAAGRNWCTIALGAGGFVGNPNVYFDLANGLKGTENNGTGTITPIGGGWYRLSVTATSDASASSLFGPILANADLGNNYLGDGTSGVYFWGHQGELGSAPSSYIATSGGTVTRNPDAIGCATSTYPHSATNGTFIVWIAPRIVNETAANRLIALNDGTVNEATNLVLVTGDTPDSFGLDVIDGGVAQVVSTVTKTGSSSLSGNKVAAFYKANDCGVLVGGGSEVTDVTATMPTVTAFNLGYDAVTGSRVFTGYIYQLTYVPRRMTQLEMQTRTA